MSVQITFYKKLNKTLDILGKKFKLKVEYSDHEQTPYTVQLDGVDVTFTRRRWSRNLEDVPTMLAEVKQEAEDVVRDKQTVEDNIDTLTQYFNDI